MFVVDKPVGPTSHDVVAQARRALGTRRVGHAGTLDPMASGVLVVLAGEATKLAAHLTLHDKRYVARVRLGVATDSLDAEGHETARADVPGALAVELDAAACAPTDRAAFPTIEAALALEAARTEQIPPLFSAIHVDGVRSHERARARRDGEADALEPLAPRPVVVRALAVATGPFGPRDARDLDVSLDVGKGYYVRSFARDVGERLGLPAHLVGLRRVASGPFSIHGAVPPSELATAAGMSASEAARLALGVATLTEAGVARARQGRALSADDFAGPPPAALAGWLDSAGELVALGAPSGDAFIVVRGFN
ncbi:MAG TPA: tRNA pseudouridine(55) synthase TruB [Byssovorax sp.]